MMVFEQVDELVAHLVERLDKTAEMMVTQLVQGSERLLDSE